MATLPSSVRPGDLITSKLVNDILDHLRDHDSRLIVLEGGSTAGQVIISDVLPGDLVQVNQAIQILGSNFDVSSGSQRVYFDTQPVTEFLEGTANNVLHVRVPTIPGLPALGKKVTLTVSNLTTSATWELTVTPLPVDVTGAVDIAATTAPNPVPENANADFGFRLTSRANVNQADFVLSATITGPPWQNRLRILDENKAAVTGNTIRLTKNVPTTVFVRINPVPSGANGTAFDIMLGADAQAGTAAGDSDVRSYTVGLTTTPEDQSITIAGIQAEPAGNYSNGTISASEGNGVVMKATVALQGTATNCTATLTMVPVSTGGSPATGWTIVWLTPSPTTANNVTTLPSLSSAGRLIEFGVEPQAAATSPGKLQLKIQRHGATTFKTVTFNLQKN